MLIELLKLVTAVATAATVSLSSFPVSVVDNQNIRDIELESLILQDIQQKYPSCFLPGATQKICPFVEPVIHFDFQPGG